MIGGSEAELALVATALDVLADQLDARRRAHPALLDELRSVLHNVTARPEPSNRDIGCDVGDSAGEMPMLLRYDEAAELLRSSPSTIERAVRDGRLVAVRVGRSPRIRPTDLATFVASLPTAQRSARLEAV